MKKYLVIINPAAGGPALDKLRHDLIETLPRTLPASAYDILLTEPGRLRLPAYDYAAVVVAGGDGTVRQTVQKLMERRIRPLLGIIPSGTGNDLARACGMLGLLRGRGVAGVLDAVQRGRAAAVDVLSLNGELFFLNYYGIGADACVAQTINAFRARYTGRREALLHGRLLYGLAGLRRISRRIRGPVEVCFENAAGDRECRGMPPGGRQIMVTNIASYAAGARPSSCSRMDDGLFEVTLIGSLRHWLLLHLTRFFTLPLDRAAPGIVRFQARRLTLTWNGGLCCQLDGETFGSSAPAPPHTIAVAGRLALIVP